MQDLVVLVHRLDGVVFTLVLACGYLLAKFTAKWVIFALVERPCDLGDMAVWFGVDLSVLAAAFSVATGIPALARFSPEATALWYFIQVAFILIALASYGMFLRKRESCSAWRDWCGVFVLGVIPAGLGAIAIYVDLSALQLGGS